MNRAAQFQRTVLVTDASRGTAISMIRSLGRQGYRVLAADCDANSTGFRSRFTAKSVVYPSPATQPDAFVDRMIEIIRSEVVDLLIPVTDDTILPLSAHRREIPSACRLALPDADALDVTTNKQKTLELARRLNVPTPQTRVVSTVDEALAAAGEFCWPIVLKPTVSRLVRANRTTEHLTVAYADSAESLAAQMVQFEGRAPVLMQQYIPGVGYGVEMLVQEGRVVAAFQHRRLREVPISGGASSYRVSVPLDPVLFDSAARMLSTLSWTGLAMVEFKAGAEGVRLMEINGRPWGSLPLAVASGVDFPALLAELYLEGRLPELSGPATNYSIGIRSRNLELDLLWIGTVLSSYRRFPFLPMPARAKAIGALCGLLNPANRFDVQSIGDPWPGIVEIPKIFHKVMSKFRGERVPETHAADVATAGESPQLPRSLAGRLLPKTRNTKPIP